MKISERLDEIQEAMSKVYEETTHISGVQARTTIDDGWRGSPIA